MNNLKNSEFIAKDKGHLHDTVNISVCCERSLVTSMFVLSRQILLCRSADT